MSSILILGAKSDIAKAIAIEYATHGHDLYLAARNVEALADFATDLQIKTQKKVVLKEFDILDLDKQQNFYASLEEKPEGVISAVGYLGDQLKAQKSQGECGLILATNYTAVVNLLNIIANDFERRGSGFITGISSVAGDRGRKSNYLYGSAKAALTAYLSGLRNRLFDSGVQVLTVKPGFVRTKMTEGMDLPGKLTAQPEEVAKDVYAAQQKGKDILYTKWVWRYVMAIITSIPEWMFKKMSI